MKTTRKTDRPPLQKGPTYELNRIRFRAQIKAQVQAWELKQKQLQK